MERISQPSTTRGETRKCETNPQLHGSSESYTSSCSTAASATAVVAASIYPSRESCFVLGWNGRHSEFVLLSSFVFLVAAVVIWLIVIVVVLTHCLRDSSAGVVVFWSTTLHHMYNNHGARARVWRLNAPLLATIATGDTRCGDALHTRRIK